MSLFPLSLSRSKLLAFAAMLTLSLNSLAFTALPAGAQNLQDSQNQVLAEASYLDSSAMSNVVRELCPSDEDMDLDVVSPSSELINAISSGRIRSGEQFTNALSTVLSAKVRADIAGQDDRGGFSSEITTYTKDLAAMDKDAVKVTMNEKSKGKLFNDITGKIPNSYYKTLELCHLFNPAAKTNDHKRLDKSINAYLNEISSSEPIKYALKVTQTTMEDLKANWFGAGMGFEHVIAGELKGSSVSGYHFWFRFYDDERNDSATYLTSMEGQDDPNIYTGSFNWDPDGKGNQFKNAKKKKGGFAIGCSAPVLLAMGHIAIEVAKKNNCPSAFTFRADVNGSVYTWQMYTMGRSIRSLYPMVSREYNKADRISEAQEEVVEHIMNSEMISEAIH